MSKEKKSIVTHLNGKDVDTLAEKSLKSEGDWETRGKYGFSKKIGENMEVYVEYAGGTPSSKYTTTLYKEGEVIAKCKQDYFETSADLYRTARKEVKERRTKEISKQRKDVQDIIQKI